MAEYGYSTPYTGQRQPTLPPGYIEAATAPGRYLAQGISSIGANIGQALERYGQAKAESQYLEQRLESLSPYLQATLGNVQQGSPESKLVSSLEKYSGMSNAKKKALLADAEFFLQRKDQEARREAEGIQRDLARISLGQARMEEAGQQQLPDALRAAFAVQAGQAPTVPFRSVTSELLSRYGNLTPAQQAQVAGIAEQRAATPPAGMVPMEATFRTPAGGTVTYVKPSDTTVTSQPIPGTNMVQTMIGGKPVGSPVKAERAGDVANAYANLPESLQKTADEFRSKYGSEQAVKNFSLASGFKNQIDRFVQDVGTDQYNAADDIALIFAFMKTLDPQSAVKDTEFATAEKAGGIPERIWNLYNKVKAGEFLTDEQRRDFSKTAKKNLDGLAKEANRKASEYKKDARNRGIPEFLVVPEDSMESQPVVGQPLTSSQGLPRFMSVEEANATLGPGKTAMVRNPKTGQMQQYTTE